MNNVHPIFNEIIDSIQHTNNPTMKFTPTPQDWQAWYAHTSNKERVIESEERAAAEEEDNK